MISKVNFFQKMCIEVKVNSIVTVCGVWFLIFKFVTIDCRLGLVYEGRLSFYVIFIEVVVAVCYFVLSID